MKLINFTAPRPQFSDVNGDPLALGRVSFYSAGTTTLKTVYSDADKTAAAPNPQPLDAGGFVQDGGVWLDEGRYKVLIEKSDGSGGWVEEYTVDDIPGTPGVPGELTAATIGTIADLRLLDPGAFGAVFVSGYYEGADRGEGWFLWDANNSIADNGGTIISPNGAPSFGRWKRLLQQSKIIPQIFGAMTNTSFGVSSNMQSMIDWCNTAGNEEYLKVRLDPGNYFIDGNVDFDNNIDLEVADGVIFDNHAATSGTLTITCQSAIIETKRTAIVGSDISLVFNPTDVSINLNPAWYGPSNFAKLASIANPSTLGVRDLDVYTTLQIEAAGTSGNIGFNNMYFYDGSVFNIESTIVSVDIGEIRAENRVPTSGVNSPIFVNEFANVRIANGEIYANWFDITTAAKYDNMLYAITYAETRASTLKWPRGFSVTVTGVSTSTAVVTHLIDAGCTIDIINNLYFHRIQSGRNKIFLETSAGRPTIGNGTVFPEWFGLKASDTTVATMTKNVLCFGKLLDSMNSFSRRVLGVKGEDYYFNSSISNTLPITRAYCFEDLSLDFSNAPSGTLLELTASLEWNNVTLTGNNLTTGILLKSNSTKSTLNNCTLTNGSSRNIVEFDLCTNLRLYRVEFDQLDVTLKGGNVSECVFSKSNLIIKRDFVPISTYSRDVENVGENIALDVLNNEFKVFGFLNADQSRIEFRGSAANTVFFWITVKNNFWTGGHGGTGVSYMMFTTNANNQYNRVDIYDNTVAADAFTDNDNNAIQIPTTRFKKSTRQVSSSDPSYTGSYTWTIPTEMLILTSKADSPIYSISSLGDQNNGNGYIALKYNTNFPDVEYYYDGQQIPLLFVEFYTSIRNFDVKIRFNSNP